MNTIKKVLVAMGLVLAAQGVAQAGPIVPTFSYTLSSAWTSATYTNGATPPVVSTNPIPGFNPPGTTSTPTLLSWGIPDTAAGQSSLGLTNPAPGTVTTYTGAVLPPPPEFIAAANILTHTNHPVFAPFLLGATLSSTLTLTNPNSPPEGPGQLPTLSFNITFAETTNAEPCASSSPGNPCNDIFALVGTPDLAQSFLLDGNTYFVNVFPIGATLGGLTAAECAAAGQPTGCLGFRTAENAITNLPFGFTVSTIPAPPDVPEPGSLALMGLGLMGFAAASRKRKNA